jgi:hypothetical protein
MLGTRSMISLSQFLSLQRAEQIETILEKRGLAARLDTDVDLPQAIRRCLSDARPDEVEAVLDEIVNSQRLLYRATASPKYLYNERWEDLVRCVALDGYQIRGEFTTGYGITRVDPTIEAAISIEDDLTARLERSNLPEAAQVVTLMRDSAEHFRSTPQDLNGALNSARVALQTLGTAISRANATSRPTGFDESKWGQVVAHLRTSGFVSQEEEKGLAGVFSFLSPGSHTFIGLSEQETVRLGRSFAAGMCYFLVKKYNG